MGQFVSDVIGEEYKNWGTDKPVVIHAPTGTGKTHFVLNILLPYVRSLGKTLVYMANRTALKEQVEKDVLKAILRDIPKDLLRDIPKNVSTDNLRRILKDVIKSISNDKLKEKVKEVVEDYEKSIVLCSYQEIASIYHLFIDELRCDSSEKEERAYRICHADFYVLDEAHFFLSDAIFFEKMEKCATKLKTIRERINAAVWVYMTATVPYLALFLQDGMMGYNLERDMLNSYLSCPIEVSSLLLYKHFTLSQAQKLDSWMEQVRDLRARLIEATRDEKDCTSQFAKQIKEYVLAQEYIGAIRPDSWMFNQEYYMARCARTNVNDTIQRVSHYYFVKQDFSYLDPGYFDNWDEVAYCIERNMHETGFKDKWLIFVRKEETAKELIDRLNSMGMNEVVFISAKSKQSGGIKEKQVYKEIVENEAFTQNVLISTKVLDNGINLKDPDLKHIVIDYFEETTFLQMLGRKRRLDENERVELFLRNVSEGSVRKAFRADVLIPIKFWRELMHMKDVNRPNNDWIALESFEALYMEAGQYKMPYKVLLEPDDYEMQSNDMRIRDDKYIKMDQYKPAYHVREKIAYDFYEMMAMFERMQKERMELFTEFIEECMERQYSRNDLKESNLSQKSVRWVEDEIRLMTFLNDLLRVNPGNRFLLRIQKELICVDSKAPEIEPFLKGIQYMWIREQLSWIGFDDEKYNPMNPDNWALTKYEITSYYGEQFVISLESVASNDSEYQYLTSEEQEQLKKDFCLWIQNVRPVHRYSKSRGSISVINTCMAEFGIPYLIISKKKAIKGKQKKWWVVLRKKKNRRAKK